MKIQGTVSLTLVPRKITEEIVLSVIRCHKQNRGIGTTQLGFMKVYDGQVLLDQPDLLL